MISYNMTKQRILSFQTGWVVKSIEDLKLQGVTEIKNIPWNGVN